MSGVITDLCLAAALGCVVLAIVGFYRFSGGLAGLHGDALAAVAGGFFLVLAALSADGASVRSMKIVGLLAILLVGGAASNHALGRALYGRSGRNA